MTNLFKGAYPRTVVDYRICFPRELLSIFDEQPGLVYNSEDGCLVLYNPKIDKPGTSYRRWDYRFNRESGILTLPKSVLLSSIGLREKVIIVGIGSGIEIWGKEKWEAEIRKSAQSFKNSLG